MALYHTYRPQRFADVLGQEIITKTLSNQILLDRVAHAYLFSGPRGVGKTTTARILAKSLACTAKIADSAEPCNTCSACQSITEGNAIDIIEIDAASNTGVDHVREVIIESAQTRPTSLPYKIFIIDEVHMLSKSAFNALLKTLEEPPKHVVFILATTEPEKLPETIISRCQHFYFTLIPDEILRDHITALAKTEGVTIAEDILHQIIRRSGGCGRDAVRFLDQLLGLGIQDITATEATALFPMVADGWVIDYLHSLLRDDLQGSLDLIHSAQESGQHIPTILNRLLEILRAGLLYHTTKQIAHGEVVGQSDLEIIQKESTPTALLSLFDITARRKKEIGLLPLPFFVLELIAYEWSLRNIGSSETPTTPPRETIKTPPIAPSTQETIQSPTKIEKQTPPPIETSPSIVEKEIHKESKEQREAISLTQEGVETIWKSFLTHIERNAPSLIFILHMTSIQSVSGDTITLSVPYAFHKDKLVEAKTYGMLTQTLATLLNVSRTTLDVVVSEKETKTETPSPDIAGLAAAFGGQLVS